MQAGDRPIRMQPLNRGNCGAFGLTYRHQTTTYRRALQQNGAGATIAGVATDLGTGQAQIIAQRLAQTRGWRNRDVDSMPIDRKAGHG